MAKRKQLKNIAQGLLNSFISRNNDVYGYWGIGKLYALMLDKNSSTVTIDLLEKSIIPDSNEFNVLLEEFKRRFMQQMTKNGLKESNISSFDIVLTAQERGKMNLDKGLTLIKCTFRIIDDLDRVYSLEKEVMCRKHNPKLEMKSSRKYTQINKKWYQFWK